MSDPRPPASGEPPETGQIIGCNHIAWGSVAECPYCGVVNDMVPKAVHREEVAEALATDPRPPVSGEPSAEPLAPEHVIDRHGFVWRVVRDGGMATRADYTGQTSIGLWELQATRGPLIDLEPLLAEARATPPPLDVDALTELERDLAAGYVEHMGDVWQRLRAILDEPGQRALAARLTRPTSDSGEPPA
jgi:hypothetical protein